MGFYLNKHFLRFFTFLTVVMLATVTTQEAQNSTTLSRKQRKVFKRLGISLTVFGTLSLVLGTANLILAWNIVYISDGDWSRVAVGIWTGILVLLIGGSAIGTANQPSRFKLISGTILTLFAAFSCVAQTWIEFLALIDSYNWLYPYDYAAEAFVVSSHGIQAVIGFASFITTIVYSVFCCKSNDCCVPERTVQTVIVYTTAPKSQSGHSNPAMVDEDGLPTYAAVIQQKSLEEYTTKAI